MTIVAIETSSSVCSVAVCINDSLVSVAESHLPNVHDSALVSIVQQALDNAHIGIHQIDVVAVSAGPGSFTGLRIGVGFVKGLCHTGSPALLAVPTLLSIAVASAEVAKRSGCGEVLCVIPSHRGLYYIQRYSVDHALPVAVSDVALMSVDQIYPLLLPTTLLAGPGSSAIDSNVISGLSRLSARFISRTATLMINNGAVEWTAPHEFEPMYLQGFGDH